LVLLKHLDRGGRVHTDLDTLVIGLYVKIDDALQHTPLRQLIESVNDTLKGQLDLERHGGRTIQGVTVRVLQRLLALTAAIWHNRRTGQPVLRSLIAYDHC
jgi:hypothetical protein